MVRVVLGVVRRCVHVFASAAEEPRNEGNADLNEEMTWSKVRIDPLHLHTCICTGCMAV